MTPEEQTAAAEELSRAYQLTFNSQSGQRVLQDLMAFSKFRLPIEDKVDEGKRQVVLRIMDFSQFNFEELKAVYRGRMAVQDPNWPAQGAHGHVQNESPPA